MPPDRGGTTQIWWHVAGMRTVAALAVAAILATGFTSVPTSSTSAPAST